MADGSGSDNPFENLPMFGDLARALSGQGPLNWDAARQFAALAATGGASSNIDPTVRTARRVVAHRRDACVSTGLDGPMPEIVRSRGDWAQRMLDAYRPLFTSWPSLKTSALAEDDPGLRRRPDDGNDGRAQQDDGAVDDGHGRRLDGRSHGHSGVRAIRPAHPPPGHQHQRAARQHRSVRRGVEHHPRRDADVGACSGTHGTRVVLDQQSSRVVRRAGSETRRRVPPRSRGHRREVVVVRHRRRRPDAGDAATAR